MNSVTTDEYDEEEMGMAEIGTVSSSGGPTLAVRLLQRAALRVDYANGELGVSPGIDAE